MSTITDISTQDMLKTMQSRLSDALLLINTLRKEMCFIRNKNVCCMPSCMKCDLHNEARIYHESQLPTNTIEKQRIVHMDAKLFQQQEVVQEMMAECTKKLQLHAESIKFLKSKQDTATQKALEEYCVAQSEGRASKSRRVFDDNVIEDDEYNKQFEEEEEEEEHPYPFPNEDYISLANQVIIEKDPKNMSGLIQNISRPTEVAVQEHQVEEKAVLPPVAPVVQVEEKVEEKAVLPPVVQVEEKVEEKAAPPVVQVEEKVEAQRIYAKLYSLSVKDLKKYSGKLKIQGRSKLRKKQDLAEKICQVLKEKNMTYEDLVQ